MLHLKLANRIAFKNITKNKMYVFTIEHRTIKVNKRNALDEARRALDSQWEIRTEFFIQCLNLKAPNGQNNLTECEYDLQPVT